MSINKTIHTKEGIIEYSICGSGTPVLFVHGGHVDCRFNLPLKGLDPKKYTLLMPSRPGYGKTLLNNHKSAGQTAKLFISLLDALQIDKVIVYGTSAGGLTALEIASQFPERVNKLILVSAVTMDWLDKKGKIYKGAKIIFNPYTEWLTWKLVRLFSSISPRYLVKYFMPYFSTSEFINPAKSEISEFIDLVKIFQSKKGFVNDIDQTINAKVLQRIQCPTLILHSINDNSVSPEHAENAKKEIKGSKLVVLDNTWGHMIWIGEEYQKAKEVILDFIN